MVPNKCCFFVRTEKSVSVNIDGSNGKNKIGHITGQLTIITKCSILDVAAVLDPPLMLTYKDSQSSFKKLLEKDHYLSVYHKNLQTLVTKSFKVKNDIAPDTIKDAFELK